MHTYRIRLFAAAKQRLAADSVELRSPAASLTTSELRAHFADQYPQIAALIQQSRIAVNEKYAAADLAIQAADEIALIPPVSGG